MLKVLELQKALDEKRAALEVITKRDFETRKADIEKRLAELTTEATAEEKAAIEADAEALAKEQEESEAELETVRGEIEKLEKELEEAVEKTAEPEPDKKSARSAEGEKKMEIRDSKEYIEAFARYIRTEGKEMRAILTENATNGTVPVPTFVEEVVRTAWDREGIIRRVKKAYLKGNIKAPFEISGTGATVHTEGGAGVAEETLVMGTVALNAEDIKKWVSVSDKVLSFDDDGARTFLTYIYDELTYRIALRAADQLLADINACGTESTTTCVGVPKITISAIGVGTVASAMALLSGMAQDPIVVINRQSWGDFKAAQYAASYPVDPFEGLDVEYNNQECVPFSVATTGETIAIVGDFGYGALANFPDGETIQFKFDDKTLMTQDLVRILGRRLSAIKPVAPNAFVRIVKAADE